MVEFIETVISRYGGRPAGTEAERNAQRYVQEELGKHCDAVQWHAFETPLKAKFHALKGFCIAYLVALALFTWNAWAAAALALVNGILFLGHFVAFQDWLDFLYKKEASQNVIGSIEPKGEVRSTLVISGHIDSVREFQWWYKLGHLGGVLTTLSGFLIALQGFTYLAAALTAQLTGGMPLGFEIVWWAQLILSPILITFYSMHGKLAVDGALDNLTGVALAVEMARVFGGDNRLEHTRLKLVSYGSEETGLRGSRHYVKDHYDELRAEGAVNFNIDTIKSDEHLSLVRRELNPMTRYPEHLIGKAQEAFRAEGVAHKVVSLPVGATDGTAFVKGGLPAISMIGLTTKKFDPTYHTRLDNLSNLDPAGLHAVRKALVRFIRDWDRDMQARDQSAS